jgi:hypothetical protein
MQYMGFADIFRATIENGGGTFRWDDESLSFSPVTEGIAVGIIDGTFRTTDRALSSEFEYAIWDALDESVIVGTWVDGLIIHIDPVRIFTDEDEARAFAVENNQLAYYVIHEQREVRL